MWLVHCVTNLVRLIGAVLFELRRKTKIKTYKKRPKMIQIFRCAAVDSYLLQMM